MEITRQYEQVRNQKKECQQTAHVDAVRQNKPFDRQEGNIDHQTNSNASECNYCGYASHTNKTNAPLTDSDANYAMCLTILLRHAEKARIKRHGFWQ